MKVLLQVESNEIEYVKELSSYNNLIWKFKTPKTGFTHMREIYDDVSEWPSTSLGKIIEGGFWIKYSGESDGVDADKIGCGGHFTNIHLYETDFLESIQ